MCSERNKIFIEGANPEESKIAPIHAAAMSGDLEAITLILSRNVDINHTDQNSAGYSALIYAIIKNRVDVVKCLLANGANVNHKTIEGSTALHGAANTRGNKDMLLLLIEARADVNARDVDGNTALNLASVNGFLGASALLLDSRADVNTADERCFETPLMNAVIGNHQDVVQMLLSRGASLELRNRSGMTALTFACTRGNLNIVRSLLGKGADVNDNIYRKTPLFIAAENGHNFVVKELLNRNADIDTETSGENITSLYVAAQHGHLEVMSCLITFNANVDFVPNGAFGSKSALMLAAERGDVPVMEALIDKGNANVNLSKPISGFTSLHLAVSEGHGRAVFTLLNSGAQTNVRTSRSGETPILMASRAGDARIVSMLLRRGGSTGVAQANSKGEFPLLVAAELGHCDIARLLVEGGADVNQVNLKDRSNALYHALNRQREDVAEFLLDCGSRFNIDGCDGTPLLLLAVQKMDHRFVKKMLRRSTDDVNLEDSNGETALCFSTKIGDMKMVKILLKHRAYPDQCDRYIGTPPLLIASFNGHFLIVQELLKANADVNVLRSHTGENALHMAAKGSFEGTRHTVEVLLEHGCSVDAICEDGYRPMDVARSVENQLVIDILQFNETYREVARHSRFKQFSEYFLEPFLEGEMPIPMSQWVSIMHEERRKSIFEWAAHVVWDCENCFRVLYANDIIFGTDENPPGNLVRWREVIHDGTACLRELVASFLVPGYRTRRLVRMIYAFGMIDSYLLPTPAGLSAAVAWSQRAVALFNKTLKKIKNKKRIREPKAFTYENTVYEDFALAQSQSGLPSPHACNSGHPVSEGSFPTLSDNIGLCQSDEKTEEQPLPLVAGFEHQPLETNNSQQAEEVANPRKRPSIFAFPNSNCKVVSATRGTYGKS